MVHWNHSIFPLDFARCLSNGEVGDWRSLDSVGLLLKDEHPFEPF